MTRKKKNSAQLKRFEDVLTVYGADPARWPQDERAALTALARSDGMAARLFDEATALDKVMALAPAGEAGDELKQRIVSAAVSDGSREARVVPLNAGRDRSRGGIGTGVGVAWPAVAMVASFVLGLYLGIAGLGTSTVGTALDLAALSSTTGESDSIDFLSDIGAADSEGII